MPGTFSATGLKDSYLFNLVRYKATRLKHLLLIKFITVVIVCAYSIAVIKVASEIDMTSLNSGLVYCIHFYTNSLEKGMNQSLLITALV